MTAQLTNRRWDILIVGGGPAGSILASLLAPAGYEVLVLERDIHPREHVGESLTPSTGPVFERIGFLDKMEEAGFVHKPGAAWTAPRSPVGKFVTLRLNEFPMRDAPRPYTYNVERDLFDAMLIRHAHEQGAKVLQGVRVESVIFNRDRAVGVRTRGLPAGDGDVFGRLVVDGSGRRCLVASQLGLKSNDPLFSQYAVYSWFRDLPAPPEGTDGMLFLHFLDLERAWAWQIPLRNGVWSLGFVTDRADFRKSGAPAEDFVATLVRRNANLSHSLQHARRITPWRSEGDYSYRISQVVGPGWLLVGDALRFVDPVFSTGVDVAAYSALLAFEAIQLALAGGEEAALRTYQRRVTDGVEAWYDLIKLFYQLQNLFTYFALKRETRESVVRILQGNLYDPASLARAREMIALMESAHSRVMSDPFNLLRPGALNPSPGLP